MPLHTGVLERRIDGAGTAFVTINVRGSLGSRQIECVIDTGYTGGLLLGRDVADELGLQDHAITYAALGDGSIVWLTVSEAQIECGGQLLGVDVYIVERTEDGNGAVQPLLGVALLAGHELTINYRASTIRIT